MSTNASPFQARLKLVPLAATIFVSAFLLFQVQPLISKFILPWFGGSPTVWSTCMLFFQMALFGGYLYAHLTSQFLTPKRQAILHLVLLVAAAALLPITPDDSWKQSTDWSPTLSIVALLTVSVGLPYFILSSTGPLLQRWFSLQSGGSSPYRLYALSNIGSLIALVSYPFVFEPSFSSPNQASLWSWGFITFGLLCGISALSLIRANPVVESSDHTTQSDAPQPTWADRCFWFFLAMVASVMLLATTNQVCLDVATVPFLWILPLTIYLMSFILCFDSERWYRRDIYVALLIVSLLFVVKTLLSGSIASIFVQVAVFLCGLFFCCMVCHGELARQKPGTKYLTQFYLLVSAGGAGGGLFVGMLAPHLFAGYWELHFGIVACLIASLLVYIREARRTGTKFRIKLIWTAVACWMLWALQMEAGHRVAEAIEVSRNFYGVLRVEDESDEAGNVFQRSMFHGNIRHGSQFTDPDRRHLATAYYAPDSGAGLAMLHHKAGQKRKIGVIGLGVGTLATYCQQIDTVRFFEINPDVERLARKHFTYLSDTKAECKVVLGDARLVLEQLPAQKFDLLMVDAFSGDAIPAHLLTREAMQTYLTHTRDDGLLCFHISNLHFDLQPLLAGLADDCGLKFMSVESRSDKKLGRNISDWIVMSRHNIPQIIADEAPGQLPPTEKRVIWTDEYSNLLSVLR